MRARRSPEHQRREMAPAPAAPARSTPAELVAQLQRTAGNARVSRLLARTPSPAVPADVATWLADHPTANDKVAAWLLAGEKLGFITFRADGRLQMVAL